VAKVDDGPPPDPYEFSLVLGGPLYQLFRRTWLSGDTLELVRRRLLVLVGVTWLPLLLLAALEGNAWRGAVRLPFLFDVDLHARLLVALPLLVVAELVVHTRMRPVIRQFLDRGLIPDRERARFDAALASAHRLRNSLPAEILLMALVYGVGVLLLWRRYMALDVGSWYGGLHEGRLQPSLAGWWYGCVSLPLFQFLLLRWYFRLFVWARFLWHVSRLDLDLVPTHPDRSAGLGFLANTTYAFAPLLLAQGTLLSGMMANRILFDGARLPQFKVDAVGAIALVVLMVVGPLLVFAPLLERAKRTGLREYGTLAQGYVREFDRKWLRGGAAQGEALLGSGDIQSLADLGNSFETIRQMRWIPFTMQNVVQLAVTTLIPILPLTLTMFSVDELVQRLLKVAF
jgi:hypothetical protein